MIMLQILPGVGVGGWMLLQWSEEMDYSCSGWLVVAARLSLESRNLTMYLGGGGGGYFFIWYNI